MDIGIFDSFEEDGQLTLFGMEEELEELQLSARERARKALGGKAQKVSDGQLQEPPGGEAKDGPASRVQKLQAAQAQQAGQEGDGIRIRRCASCGKLLFVREEDGGGYSSACNACGIFYVQKA